MKHVFKGFAAAVAMTAAGAIAASAALADTSWPTKPITMLIGYKAAARTRKAVCFPKFWPVNLASRST